MPTPPSAPSPAAIADAMRVAELGGDLGRLALVCTHQAALNEDEGRQRLVAAAGAMSWAQQLLDEIEKLEKEDDGRAL